jgi:hypothetical protein
MPIDAPTRWTLAVAVSLAALTACADPPLSPPLSELPAIRPTPRVITCSSELPSVHDLKCEAPSGGVGAGRYWLPDRELHQ